DALLNKALDSIRWFVTGEILSPKELSNHSFWKTRFENKNADKLFQLAQKDRNYFEEENLCHFQPGIDLKRPIIDKEKIRFETIGKDGKRSPLVSDISAGETLLVFIP